MTEVHTQPLDEQAVHDLITGGSPEEQAEHEAHFHRDPKGHIAGIINSALGLFPLDRDPGAFVETLRQALVKRPYLVGERETVQQKIADIVRQKKREELLNPKTKRLTQRLESVLELYTAKQK